MKLLTEKCQAEMAAFRKERKNAVGTADAEKLLDSAFKKIAEYVLRCGHFEADGVRIYPNDIEFYYHEEGEGNSLIKDPVMYHTLDHEAGAPYVLRRGGVLPYFKPGTLNPHISGIDFTFENEKEHYRASFLIRGYLVDDAVIPVHYPTHLYEDLLFMGIPEGGTGIHWVENERPREGKIPDALPRVNVTDYEKENDGTYKKNNKGKYIKRETPDSKPGNRKYVECPRRWRFMII